MGNFKHLDRSQIRKGDLVRLSDSMCFTKKNGGKLDIPLTSIANDEEGIVDGFYRVEMLESERYIPIYRDRIYMILKPKTTAVKNFRKVTCLSLILDTHSGNKVYIRRDLLEKI